MKNYEIVSIVNAFEKLKKSDEIGPLLPASVAWKRRLNLRKLLEANSVISEALDDVSERFFDDDHSTKDPDSDLRRVKPEFLEEFAKLRAEVLEQETELEIKKVKIKEIGDIVISDSDMDTLAFMIEE